MSDRVTRQPVVITGMHRSGTSWTASLLSQLSVNVGDRLLEADGNNRAGYFEDLEFLELQREIMAACTSRNDGGHPDWGWTESQEFNSTHAAPFLPRARELVAKRCNTSSPWGWKDPRTTILLDFWDDLLRDARYLFVYRFPWDVADSMQRLGAPVFLNNPEYAYRIWTFYNRRVLDFFRRHPDRCALLSVNGILHSPDRLWGVLQGKLGLQVSAQQRQLRFQPDIFHTICGADPLIDLVSATSPDCVALLKELDAAADISASELWRARPLASRLSRQKSSYSDDNEVKLSVVIPCYDHGQFLIDAVASLDRTAPAGCELIVVDDGSRQPRTREILNILAGAGYKIVWQQNEGLSSARNRGIELARGRYILPLDADNRVRPGFLTDAIQVLDSSPDVGVVYGSRHDFGMRNADFEVAEFDLKSLMRWNYIDACAVFRRQIWQDGGGYDPAASPLEDWELWIAAAEKGWEFHRLPGIAFDYRVRPDSLISVTLVPEVQQRLMAYIIGKHYQLYRPTIISDLARETFDAHSAEQHLFDLRGQLMRHIEEANSNRRAFEEALKASSEAFAASERDVQSLRSELAEVSSSYDHVRNLLAERQSELKRIKESKGWKLLQIYGRIKHRYLIPVCRMLGLRGNSPPR